MKLAALPVYLTSAAESLSLHSIEILICVGAFVLHKTYIEKEENLVQI